MTTQTEQSTGSVKFFDPYKKWGILTPDNGEELWFHGTYVRERTYLEDTERVSFETAINPRNGKLMAINIKRL
tara:strand:+ start:9042 stop:9260 length:219 start_codon:yes stop_codon:yes gene_type:complete